MKNIVRFQLAFEGYEQRDGKLYITGYASTPEIDRYNSIVVAESFNNGIKNYLNNPIILLGHNPDKAIGVMTKHSIEPQGFKIEAEISADVDNVFSDITEGRTKGFSIGFIPIKSEYKTKGGKLLSELTEDEYNELSENDVVRVISEIELVEISVVNVPANPSSLFSLTKAVRAYFDKMEKRGMMDMERRVLVPDKDNPFLDIKQTEKKEEVEENNKEEVEEVQEEAEEVQEEETEEEKQTAETEAISEDANKPSIPEEVTTEEVEEVVEDTTPAEQEDQTEETTEEEPLAEELAEERRLNAELLEQMEKLVNKVEDLQNKLSQKPVNKPVLYSMNKQKDQFAEDLYKAKYGQ